MSYLPNVLTIAQGAQVDAFRRLRVSNANTVFDSQQEYGLDTLRMWDCTANGTLPTILAPNGSVVNGSNLVGPRDANTRMTPITVSGTVSHYSILQSRQYPRYIPGKSHLVEITGIFAPSSGCTMRLVLRTSTSGTVSDANAVSQSAWSYDKMDGTGPSGIVADFTKTQILVIDAQWLGVGCVSVYLDIHRELYLIHQFFNANSLSVPYTQSFNLPVRLEGRNTGAAEFRARVGLFDSANGVFLEAVKASAGGTIQFVCCSVQSEGGEEARGFPQSQNPGTAQITVTTRRPVFSIRPSATFSGLTNRAHIALENFWLTAQTNNSIYEVVVAGTLTGASWFAVGNSQSVTTLIVGVRYKILALGTTTNGQWNTAGALGTAVVGQSFVALATTVGTGTVTPENSCVEYDISATAIVGGGTFHCGEVISGSGSVAGTASGIADFRNPIVLSQIDALAATQLPVSIVCTSVSASSLIRAGMNWHEQTV